MSRIVHDILDGTAKRNPLNLFPVLQAENEPIGQWVAHTFSTPIPTQDNTNSVPSPFNGYTGATASSWAFGNHLHPIGGTTYFSSYGVAYGTDLLILSIFVRPTPSNMPVNFTIGFETDTLAYTHGHRFFWDAAVDNFTLTGTGAAAFTGGHGFVDPTKYEGGWRRVGCAYQVGWDTGVTDLDVAGNTFGTFFYPNGSTECDVWGQMLERRTAVTAGDSTIIAAKVAQMQAQPYLIGMPHHMDPAQPLGPMTFACTRARYSPGVFGVSMRTTPDAGVGLLRKVSLAAPWEVSATPLVEGNMNSDGSKTAASVAYPWMRVCITELNNTTTTLGAWYNE